MLVWFKKFNSYIYGFAIVDILFRILYFIRSNVNIPFVNDILSYLPTSTTGLIEKYASGVLKTILLWVVVILYIIFEYETIKLFKKKRK
jgi:hypothetical protein